ncbi:hypothetical protein [Epibacterium ulvae]|uniref:hypothetical protein n=1 Tax=Epibacterium ulvae TaxID=1156985 RepID=UPI0024916583|nr:hypothetical protein [Epibacterium ulvae]
MTEDIARELGEISATLKHMKEVQEKQGETLATVDSRLRKVETRSAINGAITGGVMAVAVTLIKDKFKI